MSNVPTVTIDVRRDVFTRYLWLYHLRDVLFMGGELKLSFDIKARLDQLEAQLTADELQQAKDTIQMKKDTNGTVN